MLAQCQFFDMFLQFGTSHDSTIFPCLSDGVSFMMRHNGFDVIIYIDDFVGIGISTDVCQVFYYLLTLLPQLGLDISERKVFTPSTEATCLGVETDTTKCTFAIPLEKLKCINFAPKPISVVTWSFIVHP